MRRPFLLTCGLLLFGVAALGITLLGTRASGQDLKNHETIKDRIAWWQKNYPKYTLGVDIPVPGTTTPLVSGKRGIALAIGLNSVDPGHYDGWSGKLGACENDARGMAQLAGALGPDFEVRGPLLTRDATHERVFAEIRRAAQELKAGDIFFLSYSGHGGQVDDENGDEGDKKDETWCLFNREVLDDELAALWTEFAPGVRILVLSDSCHSGTVAKFKEYRDILRTMPLPREKSPNESVRAKLSKVIEVLDKKGIPDEVSPIRAIPEPVQDRVVKKNRAFYTNLGKTVRDQRDSEANIKASVLLLSGCQDNQLSIERGDHGIFTQAVLDLWAGGSFSGDYAQFHKKLHETMPVSQSPNLFPVGVRDPAFAGAKPFTIPR